VTTATEYTWEPERSNAAAESGKIRNLKKFITTLIKTLPAYAGTTQAGRVL